MTDGAATGAVGIVGAGRVGSALARRFRAVGVDVVLGLREGREVPEPLAALGVTGGPASALPGLVFLAVPAPAAIEAVAAVPAGTIVVDCSNPVRWDEGPVVDAPAEGSVAAALAAARPDLRVLKGFNTFGAEWHADPESAAGPATVPFAGDDAEAKAQAMALATRAGFAPLDAGPLRNAALLEHAAVLWIHLATAGGLGRGSVFVWAGRG
ncbi:MAG: NAD(P)-binding domain-containing protein [Myxococcota bacterium]